VCKRADASGYSAEKSKVSLSEKWQAMVIHGTAFSVFAGLCERYNLIPQIHLSFSTRTGGRDVLLHPVPSCTPISSCLRDLGGCKWVLDPTEQQSLPLSPSPSQTLPAGWPELHILASVPSSTLQMGLCASQAEPGPGGSAGRRKTQRGTQRAQLAPSPAQGPACPAELCHPIAGVVRSPAPSPPQRCLPAQL